MPIAVIEAKDNSHSVGAGMQQALEYAEVLDVPFAYSSNGDAFLEHDRTVTGGVVTREIPLDQFPRPDELWTRYCLAKGLTDQQIAVAPQDYFDDGSQKSPRYYQLIAINRTVEAIARGENRILLVMATGTGKTYTAFQIIWRLILNQQQSHHVSLHQHAPFHPRRGHMVDAVAYPGMPLLGRRLGSLIVLQPGNGDELAIPCSFCAACWPRADLHSTRFSSYCHEAVLEYG